MNDNTKPTACTYRVRGGPFDRVKRDWQVILTATSEQDLQDQLLEFFDAKLAATHLAVEVRLDEGQGSVEYGRFSDFYVEELGEGVEA